MKKLLIVLLALTVVGIFAVAEDAPASISIGGWGRAWFNVVHGLGDGGDPVVDMGPGWANGTRVSVGFNGNSENAGFNWNPGFSGGQFSLACDQAKIWIKPSSLLKIELGQIQGDVLRGKLDDFGDILDVTGKDAIFKRFEPSLGMLINITPVEGAYLGMALNTTKVLDQAAIDAKTAELTAAVLAGTMTAGDAADALAEYMIDPPMRAETLENTFKAVQVGAGYVIPNVGHFRAQYIGNVVSDKAKAQVAFAFTGMEGLLVDAGVTIPFNMDFDQLGISVGASYAKDALSAYGRVDAKLLGPTGGDKFNTEVAAQVYYTVAAPLSVGVETLFEGMSPAGSDADKKTVDIYPVAKLGYSNGYLKVGFDAKVGLDDQDMQYALPIQVEYWF